MLRELKHPNVIEFFDIGEIATGEVRTLLLISRVRGPGHLHHSPRCSVAPFRLGPLKDTSNGSRENLLSGHCVCMMRVPRCTHNEGLGDEVVQTGSRHLSLLPASYI